MRKLGFREFLFMVPLFILLGVFSVYPILQTFSYSFFDYKLNDQQKAGLYISNKYNADLFNETAGYAIFYLKGELEKLEEKDQSTVEKSIQEIQEFKDQYKDRTGIVKISEEDSDKVNTLKNNFEELITDLGTRYELVNKSNYPFLIDDFDKAFISSNFIGFRSFIQAFKDKRIHTALWNTIVFTFFSILIEFMLGLGLAVIMNKNIRGRGAIRTLSIIPWAIPTAVAALMWSYLYDGSSGIIAFMLEKIHIINSSKDMLLTSTGAMASAIFADVWKTTPYMALLMLAGFQTIPSSVYESAKVDGSNAVTTFFKITIPLIRHSILVALLFRTLDAFRVFDLIYVLTGGGPGGSTETLSVYAYKLMFGQTNFGYGAVVVILMFICVALIATVFVKVLGTDLLDSN